MSSLITYYKKSSYVVFLGCTLVFSLWGSEQQPLPDQVSVEAPRNHERSKLLLLCQNGNAQLEHLARIIRSDLNFTDQIAVDLKRARTFPNEDLSKKIFNAGTSLCAFLSKSDDNKSSSINLLLKDIKTQQPILSTTLDTSDSDLVMTAHKGAQSLLRPLTGEDGVFLSNIAYCKQITPTQKVVCISDYKCSREVVVSGKKSINVIPAWHSFKPIVFYTQLARDNNRLIAAHVLTGKRHVVASFSGLNMQPAVSKDGKNVIICLSRSGNSELYMYDQDASSTFKRRAFRQLTFNGGNNVSPSLRENGDVIFCSDFETKTPHLYFLDCATKKTHRLTQNGYCTSPSYCEQTKEVFFSKPVNGTFQIFKLSLDNNNRAFGEKQLTFSEGDKKNPAVSSCGKYVLCSHRCSFNDGKGTMTDQIAVFNCMSNSMKILTKTKEEKSFPAWRSSLNDTLLDKLFAKNT